MKIATFNVNSVRARLELVVNWLVREEIDIALLQEIKCENKDFPTLAFHNIGYEAAIYGQKSYHGVAILSRVGTPDIRQIGLPDEPEDNQARFIAASVQDIIVASVYVPNGNPKDSDKFSYKERFLRRLRTYINLELYVNERAVVVGGDFNIIPTSADVYDSLEVGEDALYAMSIRKIYAALQHDGWLDAFRSRHPDEFHRYSFWDYQRGAWQQNEGFRIDHLLLSPEAADRLQEADIDFKLRSTKGASDHTPVWCSLAKICV